MMARKEWGGGGGRGGGSVDPRIRSLGYRWNKWPASDSGRLSPRRQPPVPTE